MDIRIDQTQQIAETAKQAPANKPRMDLSSLH